MSCFVCESPAVVKDVHHVIMQSRGGVDGPTVDLCPTCHAVTHRSAHRMLRGKSYDDLVAHLEHEARGRAAVLIKSIVLVETTKDDPRNPHPLLAVKLDCPEYLAALCILQKDRGFSSREALMNELLRRVAVQYGLVDDEAPKALTPMKTLAELRKGGAVR